MIFIDSGCLIAAAQEERIVMSAEERWVDVEEVAKHLGVRRESVYRWVDKKGFPAHRAGRLLRFKLSEVDEWVRRGGQQGEKTAGDPKKSRK